MVGGWWVGGPQCRIMPLRGPTCKIARFQAGLKFPSWTECGNNSNKLGLSWAKLSSSPSKIIYNNGFSTFSIEGFTILNESPNIV